MASWHWARPRRRERKQSPKRGPVGFDALEPRCLLSTGLNEITSLDASGFTPTSLQLNGSATLVGTNLQLTNGGANQNASAFSAVPVDVSRSFTTSFQFQLTPNGSTPLGAGFTFDIQNSGGPTELQSAHQDALGLTQGPHVAISFETVNPNPWPSSSSGPQTDNATGLYINTVPSFVDSSEVAIPTAQIDLHSGHVFLATIAYTAPTASAPGQIQETINDTVTGSSWTHTYANVDIASGFQLKDVSGQYAYAGFTASTGSPTNNGGAGYVYGQGQSTQSVLNWTWSDGTTAPALPYRGTFTTTTAALTSGGVYDANGQLVRTLWQGNQLPAGTYSLAWDGLGQSGNALDPTINPDPYTFQVSANSGTIASNSIANNSSDPTNPNASISALGVWGVAVSADGSKVWAATTGGDTAGGGFVKQLNGGGTVNAQASAWMMNYAAGSAVATDSGFLYAAVSFGPFTGGYGIIKINLASYDQSQGFSDWGVQNPDGSQVVFANGDHYLNVLPNDNNYLAIRAIAVSNPSNPNQGSLWVADYDHNLLRQYDKVTGAQIGVPIAVDSPTGVAVDASGDVWVAHAATPGGPANQISVYSPSGTLIRDVTEITGLVDVASLAIGNGNLYVADHGAEQVLVFNLSGDAATNGASPLVVGGPASFGHDNGVTTFWDLRGVAVDAQGNIYTVQNTISSGPAPGSQVEKWSPSGVSLWVSGGYEYYSVAGVFSPANPSTIYSTSLHKYTINPGTGAWQYAGSAAYPGDNSNAWSGLGGSAPPSAEKFVAIGGQEFLVMDSTDGTRILFFRLNADGSLHPSAIVGATGLADGNAWTWNDSLGNGIPLDSQIQDSGTPAPSSPRFYVDPLGNIFYWTSSAGTNTLCKLPLAGLDASGNPTYDWSKAVQVATLPATTITLDIGSDGIYVEYIDPNLGPESSGSVDPGYSTGGANALEKLNAGGALQWTIALPRYSQGIAATPGGGAVVGGMIGGEIFLIAGDGQVVGRASPLGSGVWLDMRGGSIVVSQDPTTNALDIFTEGLGYSNANWYQVTQSTPTAVFEGVAVSGATVALPDPPVVPAPPVVVVATPSAPVLNPADDTGVKGDNITSINLPRLIGTATPGVTVQLLGANGQVLGTTTAAPNGAYSVTPATQLPDGVDVLAVRAEDASGNLSGDSATLSLTLMSVPPPAPSALGLAPADDSGVVGDGLTNVTQPHLTGTGPANTTIQLVGLNGVVIGSGPVGSNGTFSVTPTAPLADGSYTITADAVDAAGNISPMSAAFTLTIDATPPPAPPAPTILAADDTGVLGDGKTSVRQPRLVGTTIPGGTVDLLDASGNLLAVATASATGAYTLQPASNLAFGANVLSVRVQDQAGTVSAPSAPFSVTIVDAAAGDFSGNGQSDLSIFRVPTAQWITASPSSASISATSVSLFGVPNYGDIPVPGDYNGSGKTEMAVFRPSTAQWIVYGPNGPSVLGTFGATGLFDIPVPGDYDGVGHAEMAVFRPSTGQWFVDGPHGTELLGTFGATNLFDIPVPGNYDGVGHTEMAVFRPSTAQWFVDGPHGTELLGTFGATNLFDIPVPGDYSGSGHTEMAVFRPSTAQWLIDGPGGLITTTYGAQHLYDVPTEASIGSLVALARRNFGRSQTIHAQSLPATPAGPLALPSAASTQVVRPGSTKTQNAAPMRSRAPVIQRATAGAGQAVDPGRVVGHHRLGVRSVPRS